MNANIEAQKLRAVYKVKATDIKHLDLLTDDQIAAIPLDKVYEWVRTGQWRQKNFLRWLAVLRVTE